MKISTRNSLRAIALFEGAKGALVLLVGFGVLGWIHRDAQGFAEEVVRLFHLNPANEYPRIFLGLIARVSDSHLWMLAAAATLYASARLAEAYGLWRGRTWAQYFGALSSAIYVPIEVYEVLQEASAARVLLLSVNVAIVVVLSYGLWGRRAERDRAQASAR